MSETPTPVNLLLDIEARQDEVLRQLTELEQRLECVLAECASFCRPKGVLPLAAAPPEAASVPAVKVA